MYSQCHHWVYVHCQVQIIIYDERSRAATPDDLQTVAKCASILVYGSQSDSSVPSRVTSQRRHLHQQVLTYKYCIFQSQQPRLSSVLDQGVHSGKQRNAN
jgi:hypothetical protein